ncbi:hypothetical protein A3D88_01080 [Candidatus Peribacteria bacterium RIFCSPHIGHO2_02_FULL_52_16]|nr:MAG: hypothetical protein A2706_05725 [Candidatus Peribacteria bacterium RIFCSPHIGHO2_01_FULL_51_35]OGJ61259.1 MAG: hypothetical protein A3D88_01080 [Candidatus Peribacteria bacterium RIFCSPHIGHO2_02_FULL_52_16]
MHLRMHERLIVWQEAYKFCVWIYVLTKKFPKEEKYGLTSQIRRSSMSVPTNIAEGNAKKSGKEKRHYMEIASASLEEVHVEILLARDLKYISPEEFSKTDQWINRISYLIMKFSSSIE